MPTLSEKLQALGVQIGARNLPPPASKPAADYPIELVVSGEFWPTPHGPIFVAETRYLPAYRHGSAGLWLETVLERLAAWANEPRLARVELETFAFVDTETSGMAGGTGTYPFLIGAGRFEGDVFRLAQFFTRDPGEEPAQLAALAEFLAPCQVLVTFNGKAFDAPLIDTRYTLAGWESPLPALAHLDLLPLARRLWRDRLPSRRLIHLELDILGFERTGDDVPGFLIPQMYFNYLRDGDARPLKGIFYHNAMDIVAMAALLNHVSQLLADPMGTVEHALDLVAIGKLCEELGQTEQAVALYGQGLTRNDLPEAHYWQTQRQLSFLHKRCGNLAAAVEVWELAAEGRQIYAHVELAKFYEHHRRDYQTALHWAKTGLELLDAGHTPRAERLAWLKDLKHRLNRLQKKVVS
ncbi:MAG TPA: ribonuclease H-like domain-containing protein [Anaerolineae bacterium]|nr:ribonuclease H-like domain-containing protein [Anaerolineae bacterium]